MDTKQAADKLGTTPRVFRVFLRSAYSTFVAVGSGSRYEFTDDEFPVIERRFSEWRSQGKLKPSISIVRKPTLEPIRPSRTPLITEEDRRVWAEEGPVTMPDIRDPRVRARVLQRAREAEDRLTMMLMAKGMHVTQRGNKVSA